MKFKPFRHLKKLNNNPRLVNSFVMMGSLILIFFLLSTNLFNGYYDYEVGAIAKEDIYLDKDVVDVSETQALKAGAIANTESITYVDFSKLVEARRDLTEFFNTLSELKVTYADDTTLLQRVYAGIEKENAYGLAEDELTMLASLSQSKTDILQNYATDITSENMSNGIDADNKAKVDQDIDSFIEALSDLRDVEKDVLRKLVHGVVVINEFVDVEATREKQDQAVAKVSDVVYKKGSLIAYKGESISQDQYDLLKDGQMLYASIDYAWLMVLGIGIFLITLWLILHFFLYEFKKHILYSREKYGLLITAMLLNILLSPIFVTLSPYFVPVPLFGMLVSIMLSSTVAVPFGIMIILILAIWHNFSFALTAMYLLGLIFSTLLSKNIRQRSQLLMNGIYTSLIMAVFTTAYFLINRTNFDSLPLAMVFIFGNGILCAILTIGVMPIFEAVFNILTPFKLLELSNPNKEILKQLMLEAPGTYHHSILVGNMAETAAHDIGADSVFARVASFYHDIGKLERPYYFKENQFAGENPHDMLPPIVSANIVKQHVIYGKELAKKHKLPEEIINIISSHHGTTVIKYFYHLEKQKNEDASLEAFTYEGPKPVSKEAVIIMLADSVEAAVRTLESPNKSSVSDLIDKIIGQKMDEGQFDDSNISLRELQVVKQSFVKVLSGIFHERIAYPDVEIPSKKERDSHDA